MVEEKKLKMKVRSFMNSNTPDEVAKEMVMEEHTQCGCQCDKIIEQRWVDMSNNKNII